MSKTRALLAIALLLALGGCGSRAAVKTKHAPQWPQWTVQSFGVSLRHPPGWQVAAGYLQRMQGKDGYVALNALQGSGLTPKSAALSQAEQALSPFGANAKLRAMRIGGQSGYLILPAHGQAKGAESDAEAIVLYPKPQMISNVPYRYLIVTSTAKDLLPIVRTLVFLHGKR